MKSSISLALLLMLLAISCKKKEDDPAPVLDQSYTQGGASYSIRFDKWVGSSIEFAGDGSTHFLNFGFHKKPVASGRYKITSNPVADDEVDIENTSLESLDYLNQYLDVTVNGSVIGLNADNIILYDRGFFGLGAGETACSFHLVDH